MLPADYEVSDKVKRDPMGAALDNYGVSWDGESGALSRLNDAYAAIVVIDACRKDDTVKPGWADGDNESESDDDLEEQAQANGEEAGGGAAPSAGDGGQTSDDPLRVEEGSATLVLYACGPSYGAKDGRTSSPFSQAVRKVS